MIFQNIDLPQNIRNVSRQNARAMRELTTARMGVCLARRSYSAGYTLATACAVSVLAIVVAVGRLGGAL